MAPAPLKINMFGEFSLQTGSSCIRDSDNRSKGVWLLLAYMIYNRSRSVTLGEYADLLWKDDIRSANPTNALKTMFHRVRSSLDPLWAGAGHQLVLRKGSTYAWNVDVPISLDVDDFTNLFQESQRQTDPDKRLELLLAALDLYHGEFLAKLGAELWVIPLAAHYRRIYIQAALEALPLLEQREEWARVQEICRAAIAHEPYMEELYCHLMRSLINLGNQRGAVGIYEEMSELLLSNFGVMPSDEARVLYRDALSSINDHTVSADMVLEQLQEPGGPGGALVCNYDIFRSIYHSVARSIGRSGDAVHLALVSILPQDKGGSLPQRSLERVVDNLQEMIRSTLRRGDVVARCSVSQFVLLLPQANYENSCMVCQRIIRAFTHRYPHSPARLQASVHALQPN